MSQSVRISALLAFPFVLILLIYPLDIFNKNAAEFGNHPAILTPFFIAMGTTALVCAGVGLLLTFYGRSAGLALTAISLWVGCAFALDDLIFPVRLVESIGFNGKESIAPVSFGVALFSCVLLASILILFWTRRQWEVARIGPFFVILFGVITAGPAALEFVRNTNHIRKSEPSSKWISTPPASPSHIDHPSVYHIVLDGFRGSMFPEALKEAVAISSVSFDGFTYFPKTRSNFDLTQVSTPVFLTGTLYREGSFKSWSESWTHSGIFAQVKTRLGTNIQAYSYGAYYQLDRWIQGREIPRDRLLRANQDVVLHLALARALPPFARPRIFQNGIGVFSSWIQPESDIIDRRPEPLRTLIQDEKERPGRGQYVFSHIYFPHPPFLVDRFCRPSSNATFLSQSACSLRLVGDFITELKRVGHYRDSVIIIHSDHGIGDDEPADLTDRVPEEIQVDPWRRDEQELDYWTSSLLLIKPAGAEGKPLVTSPRSTQLLDLPNTIYDLVGMPQTAPEGKSVMAVDYPVDPERQIFTGVRQWSLSEDRQIWFGKDFFTGKLNHFIWTDKAGLQVLPSFPVTWQSAPGGSATAPEGEVTPTAEELSRLLGVRVDAARGEVNQYLIRAQAGSADLSKVGKIHQDLGYAAGVTLENGVQIGFRYELQKPSKADTATVSIPTADELSRLLGTKVEMAPGEVNQYLIRAPAGSADLSKVGEIHQDLGYAVGITLKNGVRIGFRYESLTHADQK